jgi:hypothetical protein
LQDPVLAIHLLPFTANKKVAILVIFEDMVTPWTRSMNGKLREMDYKNKSCNDGID